MIRKISTIIGWFNTVYLIAFVLLVIGVATCNVIMVQPMPMLDLAKLAASHPHHWYQWNLLLTH